MTKEKFLYGEIKWRPMLGALALKYIAVICLCVSQIARCLQINLALNRSELFESENMILGGILKACVEIGKIAVPLMLAWMVAQIFSNQSRILSLASRELFLSCNRLQFMFSNLNSIAQKRQKRKDLREKNTDSAVCKKIKPILGGGLSYVQERENAVRNPRNPKGNKTKQAAPYPNKNPMRRGQAV